MTSSARLDAGETAAITARPDTEEARFPPADPNRLALKAALATFLATRVIVVLAAWMGVSQLITTDPSRYRGPFVEAALMWDGAWYVSVAQDGYSIPPAPTLSNVAFAPLLPMLVRGLVEIFSFLGIHFGDTAFGNYALTGVIITNVAFIAALYVLWRLVALDHPEAVANRTLWLVAAFPMGVFWSALYTESLFLLLAAACVLAARRGAWLLAGALGGLATLTRWAGVLLALVLLVEWLSVQRAITTRGKPASFLALSCIAVVPLALALHMLYLWAQFGNPLAVLRVQAERWQHKMSFFLSTYADSVNLLWQHLSYSGPRRDEIMVQGSGNSLYVWLDLGLPLLFVALGVVGLRRGWLRPGDLAWLALGLLFPLSSDNTRSVARYLLPLWPALVVASRLCEKRPQLERVWLGVSVGLMALVAYIFGNGKWIG
jgi:hypothetical protein